MSDNQWPPLLLLIEGSTIHAFMTTIVDTDVYKYLNYYINLSKLFVYLTQVFNC